MMSKKCKYALKALVRLGQEYGQGSLSIEEVAKSAQIPKKFLELILLDLKHAGYVQSKQGIHGGYQLVKDPTAISLAEIYRHFDGAIALLPCVSEKYYARCDDCPDENACGLRQAFGEVRQKTYEMMANITVESLIRRSGRKKPAKKPLEKFKKDC